MNYVEFLKPFADRRRHGRSSAEQLVKPVSITKFQFLNDNFYFLPKILILTKKFNEKNCNENGILSKHPYHMQKAIYFKLFRLIF